MLSSEMKVPAMKQQQPVKKRTSRKLLRLLFLFFAVVLVILFFRSSFSKIQTVSITGNTLVSADAIGQASQIRTGDNFFLLRPATVKAKIEAMQSIQSATVRKTFPGLVTITVQEYPRAAFLLSEGGAIQIVLADGSVIPQQGQTIPIDKPLLTNWTPDNPQWKKLCAALAAVPDIYLSDISEIKPEPTAALDDRIKMYTRSQFEVYTRISLLQDKLPYLGDTIRLWKEKNDVKSGILNMFETDYGAPVGAQTNEQSGSSAKTDKPAGQGVKPSSGPTPTPTSTPKKN